MYDIEINSKLVKGNVLMFRKFLKCLSKDYSTNLISVFGLFLTLFAIIYGIWQTNNTIKTSIDLEKKSNMLDESSELSIKTDEFIKIASLAFAYNANLQRNDLSYENREEYQKEFDKYNEEQTKSLDKLQPLILSYGSEKTIKVFSQFYFSLRELVETKDNTFSKWLKIYYYLPLLSSMVRYDITGEYINPSIFYDYYMPQFSDYKEEIIKTTNLTIEEYNLPKKLIWK